MQWHHAREDFLAQELLGRRPLCKGALARIADGKRAWCIWTRKFGANRDDNVLNILRLVVEGETNVVRQTVAATGNGDLNTSDQATVAAIAAILRAALFEASGWEMASVQLWNPSPLSVMAAKIVDPSAKVVDRYHESLASLRWHGPTPLEGTEIDWICNENSSPLDTHGSVEPGIDFSSIRLNPVHNGMKNRDRNVIFFYSSS
ncbi:MAG: hypothetical protein Q9179_002261 [Wetmoreana sp. 5 TL-2023]